MTLTANLDHSKSSEGRCLKAEMLQKRNTYFLRLRFILNWIELLGLLCVMRDGALAFAKLLRFRVRLASVLFCRHGELVVR